MQWLRNPHIRMSNVDGSTFFWIAFHNHDSTADSIEILYQIDDKCKNKIYYLR